MLERAAAGGFGMHLELGKEARPDWSFCETVELPFVLTESCSRSDTRQAEKKIAAIDM